MEIYAKEECCLFNVLFLKFDIGAEEHTCTPLHFHNAIEFIFLKKGLYKVFYNGVFNIMNEGEIFFANSYTLHGYENVKDAVVYALVIERNVLNITNDDVLAFEPFFRIGDEAFDKLMSFFDQFGDCFIYNENIKIGFANFVFGFLKSMYVSTNERKTGKTQQSSFLNILEYVNTHYHEDLSLETVSKKFFYNKNYFSRMFQRNVGIGFKEYVNRCRCVEVYKKKMLDSDTSLWQIAKQCGFTKEKTFYRVYRNYCDSNIKE